MQKLESRSARPEGETEGTAHRPARQVSGPVAVLDLGAETESLRQEPAWQTADHNAMTLSKEPDIRLVLTTLKAGAVIREHHVPGTVTVHTLTGRIALDLPDQRVDLPAGHLLVLERDILHDIEVIEDSTFLLTIAWPAGDQAGRNAHGA